MKAGRRALLAGLGAGLVLARPAAAMRREPAELLVPAPAGSAADRWARGLVPFLERAWRGQRLALRNLPGRGGLDGLAALAAAGEQRLIGMLTTPVLLARAVERDEASPLGRVRPLAALVEEPVVLVTAPGGPADLDALRSAALGAPLAAPPPGTGAHVTAMRLADRTGLPLLAFPSAAAARQAALAGHAPAAVLTLPDVLAQLRDARLVAIGLAAPNRLPLLPELPTLREAGLDLFGATRRGFALAPAADPAWQAWLLAGLETLAADPDLATQCAELGQVPRFMGPAAWGSLLARQDEALRRRWREEPWLPRRA
jgi:tripartite-type tricarboxylate transporter receptor subunit TctC